MSLWPSVAIRYGVIDLSQHWNIQAKAYCLTRQAIPRTKVDLLSVKSLEAYLNETLLENHIFSSRKMIMHIKKLCLWKDGQFCYVPKQSVN